MNFFETIMGPSHQASDGFFGNVFGSVSDGIDKVATEVLPNWVANQLNVQSKGLQAPTYNPNVADDRIDAATIQNADMKGSYTLESKDIAILGVLGVLGVVLIVKLV